MNLAKSSSLVQTSTKDGLLLHGYYSHESADAVVLQIHGFEGNFYENTFVHAIAKQLHEDGISFLTANTRGCEKIKDFNTIDGKIKTIGARYESLEESSIDIDAWVEFLLESGHKEVILQGHSLGATKVVRYLYEGRYPEKIKKLILLSPFDQKGSLQAYTKTPISELLERAKKMVDEGRGDEIVSEDFEEVKLSYKTYISWYKQDDLGRMFEFCTRDYDFPALKAIKIPTKVIVGSKDEFFHPSDPEHLEVALELIKSHIPTCESVLIKDANHDYNDHEQELAKEVSVFANF